MTSSRRWGQPGRWGPLLVAMLAGAGGIACGNDDATSGAGHSGSGPTVTIADFEFLPGEVTVSAAEAITFTNEDGQAHTATTAAGAGAGGFDSGSIAAGEPATVEVAEPGRYPYHCSFHPFMTGTVIVE